MNTLIEYAWAAGFFDGEGTTTFSNTAKSTRVQISQKEPELLHRFAAIAKAGKVCGPYRNGKGQVYQYRLCRRSDVVVLMAKLWPYLGEQKRQQAMRAGAAPPVELHLVA